MLAEDFNGNYISYLRFIFSQSRFFFSRGNSVNSSNRNSFVFIIKGSECSIRIIVNFLFEDINSNSNRNSEIVSQFLFTVFEEKWDYEVMGFFLDQLVDYFDNLKEFLVQDVVFQFCVICLFIIYIYVIFIFIFKKVLIYIGIDMILYYFF